MRRGEGYPSNKFARQIQWLDRCAELGDTAGHDTAILKSAIGTARQALAEADAYHEQVVYMGASIDELQRQSREAGW